MKRAKKIVFVAFLLTFFFGVNAVAGPVLDRILKKKVLVVGTSGNQVPFTVKTKEGKIIGMDADLAGFMATAMDVKLKIVDMPFHTLLPALEAGKVDMILSGMTITPKRNLKVVFVGPYYVSGKGILTKKQTLASLQDPSDMNKPEFNIAALKESTSQLFVEKAMSKAKLQTTPTLNEAMDLLVKDKIDALVADYPFCVVTAFRYKEKGLIAGKAPLSFEPFGIALPANDPHLANWVNNFFGILQGSDILKKLQQLWLQPGPWLKQLP